MADNRCICCGEIIPEGMIACPNCLVVSKKKEKHLIDVQDCPCDGCKAKPCGHPARCVNFALWLNKTVNAVEIPNCDKCAFNNGIAYWHQCERCLGNARNNFVSISEVNEDVR